MYLRTHHQIENVNSSRYLPQCLTGGGIWKKKGCFAFFSKNIGVECIASLRYRFLSSNESIKKNKNTGVMS